MGFQAALDALRHDGKEWQAASGVLAGAAHQAGALSLTESQLSWAAGDTGLATTYDAIREYVEMLLKEGSTVLDGLGDTLITVADAYDASDASASAAYKGAWKPRP
jgi:hypothetical protein